LKSCHAHGQQEQGGTPIPHAVKVGAMPETRQPMKGGPGIPSATNQGFARQLVQK